VPHDRRRNANIKRRKARTTQYGPTTPSFIVTRRRIAIAGPTSRQCTHMMNMILIESAILLGLRCVLHVSPLAWLTYDIDIDPDVPCSSHLANFYCAASTRTCKPFRRPPPPHSLLLHHPTPRIDFLTLYSRVRFLHHRSLRVAPCSCC
jgi:hypothetical protein